MGWHALSDAVNLQSCVCIRLCVCCADKNVHIYKGLWVLCFGVELIQARSMTTMPGAVAGPDRPFETNSPPLSSVLLILWPLLFPCFSYLPHSFFNQSGSQVHQGERRELGPKRISIFSITESTALCHLLASFSRNWNVWTKRDSVQITLCEGTIDTKGARVTYTYGKGIRGHDMNMGTLPPSQPVVTCRSLSSVFFV